MDLAVRRAQPADFEPPAVWWHEQWTMAHAQYVPAELTALRTMADFHRRLTEHGDAVRVVGPVAAPIGLCVVKGHELDQKYVARQALGSGIADLLLSDGEMRIAAGGHKRAVLVCVKENMRAQQFYRRNGWELARADVAMLDTSAGPFAMETLVFEKSFS
jgi:ribosomal protein S18 acetylase RimI-like enzyme